MRNNNPDIHRNQTYALPGRSSLALLAMRCGMVSRDDGITVVAPNPLIMLHIAAQLQAHHAGHRGGRSNEPFVHFCTRNVLRIWRTCWIYAYRQIVDKRIGARRVPPNGWPDVRGLDVTDLAKPDSAEPDWPWKAETRLYACGAGARTPNARRGWRHAADPTPRALSLTTKRVDMSA